MIAQRKQQRNALGEGPETPGGDREMSALWRKYYALQHRFPLSRSLVPPLGLADPSDALREERVEAGEMECCLESET